MLKKNYIGLVKNCILPILLLNLFLLALFLNCTLALAATENSAVQYEKLLVEYRKLRESKEKVSYRDNWDKLLVEFSKLAAKNDETAPKALFQQARVTENLAKLNKSSKDSNNAISLFTQVYVKYPKHSMADDALFYKALLLDYMGRTTEAIAELNVLIKNYKKTDSYNKANLKLQELQNKQEKLAPPTPLKPKVANAGAANADILANEKKETLKTANLELLYDSLAKEWHALLADSVKSKNIAAWQSLSDSFYSVYSQAPKSSVAAKALFQAAKGYTELALRTKKSADWSQSIACYLRLNKEFPTHSLADDSLFLAASIHLKSLRQEAEAKVLLDRLIKEYPKGDMLAKAKERVATIKPNLDKNQNSEPAKKLAKEESKAESKIENKADLAANKIEKNAEASKNILEDIAWAGNKDLCRVTFLLDKRSEYKEVFKPYDAQKGRLARLTLLFDSTKQGAKIKSNIKVGRLLLSRIKTEPSPSGLLKVTLELGKTVEYTIVSSEKNNELIIEFKGQAPVASVASVAASDLNKKKKEEALEAQASATPARLSDQLGLDIKTIMIDAGHGGKDPGAMANGVVEKKVTLNAAKMLGAKFINAGFKVIYTREKDVFITLQQRPVLANSKKADLFISFHINANPDPNVSGIETYYLDVASSSKAVKVAARENGVSISKISDLQAILADFMLNSKLSESREIANLVHGSIKNTTHKSGFNVGDNGVRSAPFYVLMGAKMPAVLVEAGYLTNDGDARLLSSDAYLNKVTDAIVGAVLSYKRKIASISTK